MYSSTPFGLARSLGLAALATIAAVGTTAHAYEQVGTINQAEVEQSIIHEVRCSGVGENGGTFYVYEYTKRPGFRAISPPDWGHAIGGKDFGTFDEAAKAACFGGTGGGGGGRAHLGCYQDAGDRDLDGFIDSTATNTPDSCIEKCAQKGFAYAGVQNAESCLCGDSYGKYKKLEDAACAMPCTGDPNARCGGAWANDVYATGVGGGPSRSQ
jgi:hypothetical protein